MEEMKEDIFENNETYPNWLNSDNSDNFKNSTFGQTVLASPESLQRLPTNIFQLWNLYLQGELPSTSETEVSSLLQAWFQGDTTSILKTNERNNEFSTDSITTSTGFKPSSILKRRRVDSQI
jgi:hypothetical protein